MLPTLPAGGPTGGLMVRGVGVPFNSVTYLGQGVSEQFAPGAFDEQALTGFARVGLVPGCAFQLFHQEEEILASVDSGSMALAQERAGLLYVARLPVAAAKEAELISSGVVSGASITFMCMDATWGTAPDGTALRTVVKAYVTEVSAVPAPAYIDATCQASGMRSAAPTSWSDASAALAKAASRDAEGSATLHALAAHELRRAERRDVEARAAGVAVPKFAHLRKPEAGEKSSHVARLEGRAGKTISAATRVQLQAAAQTLINLLGADGQRDDDEDERSDPATVMGGDDAERSRWLAGYRSRHEHRAGRRLSAATRAAIQTAIDALMAMGDQVQAADPDGGDLPDES